MSFLTIEHYSSSFARSRRKMLLRRGFFACFVAVVPLFIFAYWLLDTKHFLAQAQSINEQITYQGKVADGSGITLANGLYSFRFELYTAATGGTLLWTEDWDSSSPAGQVTVSGGTFTVALGTSTSLSTVNFANTGLFLQVYFDPGDDTVFEETFTPRKRLTASPYAFNADKLDGLTAADFLSTSTVSASNIWSLTGLGLIGSSSATTTAQGNFIITGTTRLATALTGVLKATAGYITASLVSLTTEVTGTLGIGNGGTGLATTPTYGQILVGNGTDYTLTATSSLGLPTGVGTAGMLTAWSGSGTLTATSAPTAAYYVATSSVSTSTFAGGLTVAGTTGLTVTQGGNVGIGSSTPFYKLSVDGTVGFQGANWATTTIGDANDYLTIGCKSLLGSCFPLLSTLVAGSENITLVNASLGVIGSATNPDPIFYFASEDAATQGTLDYDATGDILTFGDSQGFADIIFGSNNTQVTFDTLIDSNNTLYVQGLADSTDSLGTDGMILQTDGSVATWVATSTLGISSTNYWTLSGSNLYNNSGTLVGINTTTPLYALDVAGDINIDQYSGYKQNGETILSASSTNFSTLVGIFAGQDLLFDGLRNTAFGYQALSVATSSDSNTAIGYQALMDNTSGAINTAVGSAALANNTTGDANTAIGQNAANANTTGSQNTVLGAQAFESNTIGFNNTAIGTVALRSNIDGDENTAVGLNALDANTTGNENVAIGVGALVDSVDGSDNVAVGNDALLFNDSADSMVALGFGAGSGLAPYNNQNGVYIGYQAGFNADTGSDNNTFVGYSAGFANTTGANNTTLGYQAGNNITTGSNNLVIGYDIDAPSATASNQLNIGNLLFGTSIDGTGTTLSSGNIGIGTTTPYAKLSVVGEVVASHFTGTTTATSTFGGPIVVTSVSTSTFANGINLGSGCFAIGGACISSGGGITGSGVAGMLTAWSGPGSLTATSGPTAAYFVATSATASILPYASSTAITVSGLASTTELIVSNNATVGGTLAVASTLSAGTTTVTNLAVTNLSTSTFAGSLAVTEVNATSTFAGGVDLSDGCFALDGVCLTSGSSNWTDAGLYLSPLTAGDGILVNSASSTITNLVVVNSTSTNTTSTNFFANDLFGYNATFGTLVATSSATLASTTAYGQFITGNIIATSTATSTFGGPIVVTSVSTSTFANGINLGSGCFAISGACISGGGGITGAGVAGMLTAWSGVSSLTATSGPTAAYFVATSTTASILPYASTTAITVSGLASTTELIVSNNATIGGTLSVGGTLSAGTTTVTNLIVTNLSTSTFAGGIAVAGDISVDQLFVTGATSTFANGISLASGCFFDNGVCLSNSAVVSNWQFAGANAITPTSTVGIIVNASSSISDLSVTNGTTTNSTSTNLFVTNAVFTGATTTNLAVTGIASTSALVVSNNATIGGTLAVASTLSAGTTTVTNLAVTNLSTSTFAGSLAVTEANATSTFAGGIDLSDGCFALDGICLTSGSSNWTDNGLFLSPLTAGDGILVNSASSTITNLTMVNSTSTNASSTNLFVSTSANIKGTTDWATTTIGQTDAYFEFGAFDISGFQIPKIRPLSNVGGAIQGIWDGTLILREVNGTTETLQFSDSAGAITGSMIYTTATDILNFSDFDSIGVGLGNTDTFYASEFNDRVGVGTSTPWGIFAVSGNGTVGLPILNIADANNLSQFTIDENGFATFTRAIAVNEVNATSTFAGGIDLSDGCFALDGVCVGSGSGVTGGTAGMLTAWTSATTLTATSGPTAAYFVATSTTASILPYASTTAITVSGLASTTDLVVSNGATIGGTLSVGSTLSAGTTTVTNLAVTNTSTSTFAGAIAVSGVGTSTFSNGVNVSSGCFAVNGVCISAGGGTVTGSGVAGMLTAWSGAGSLTATSGPTAAYFVATSSIASILPYASTTAITVSGLASTTELIVSNNATIGGTLSAGTTTATALVVTNVSTSTFAGNIAVSGDLSTDQLFVTGASATSTFAGNVDISGNATTTRFYGSGLTTCTASNQALQYNAATGLFSCATLNTTSIPSAGNAYYFLDADTTLTTMVDNDTTNLWSPTIQPSITPSSTSALILVSVNMVLRAAANDDEIDVAVVRREIGAAATCSSTRVGVQITSGFTTGTNDPGGGSVSFIDTPGTTSPVFYTLCSSSESVAATTVNNLATSSSFTLVQLGADLAENYYTTDPSIVAGHLVSIDPSLPAGVSLTTSAYQKTALGIISTVPGITLDDRIGADFGRPVPVALSGRVPVKVTTANGDIMPGDFLTSSDIPGVAMKATKAGPIVGQAMTGYQGEGEGSVMVFVKNGYYTGVSGEELITDPAALTTDIGTAILNTLITNSAGITASTTLSEIMTDRVVAGLEIITPRVVTDELNTNKIIINDGGLSIDYIATSTDPLLADNKIFSIDKDGNVTVKGLLTAEAIKANQITGLEIITQSISLLTSEVSSSTDAVSELLAGNLTVPGLTINGDLTISGRLTAGDISSPMLDGLLLDFGALSSTTADLIARLGMIEAQEAVTVDALLSGTESLAISQPVALGGGLIVDQIGSVGGVIKMLDDVEFIGRPYVSSDTAGFATIYAGDREVAVEFDRPYLATPTISALISTDNKAQLEEVFGAEISVAVTDVSVDGFTIILSKSAPVDITVNWIALATKDPRRFESDGVYQEPAVITAEVIESDPVIDETDNPVEPTEEPTPVADPVIDEPTPSDQITEPTENPVADETPSDQSQTPDSPESTPDAGASQPSEDSSSSDSATGSSEPAV